MKFDNISVLKSMGHPLRLKILNSLKDGSDNVSGLCKKLRSQQSSMSQHLTHLHNAGLVEFSKKGVKSYYHLNESCLDLLESVNSLGKKNGRKGKIKAQ